MSETLESSLWDRTLAQVQASVDEETFSTFLEPTRFLGFQGQTLVVGVPTPFFRKMINSNFRSRLVSALRTVGNDDALEVDFRVQASTQDEENEIPGLFDTPVEGEAPVQEVSVRESRVANLAESRTATIELPKSNSLNARYTFDSFVVGESNRFAHAACLQVSEPGSRHYNPLFIYGDVGLGKTHLMQAIGHQIMVTNPTARVLYVTSEQFMNTFVEAIRHGHRFEFRDFFRTVDLLLIDDVQFFSGKERTQEEFFHTFNALYDAGKKIVVTADRLPKDLTMLEDRLRNRFSWGLVVDVQRPDLETRMAILHQKAEARGLTLSNDVAAYVAERVHENVRELEGVLVRLQAFANLSRGPLTLEFAREVLKDFVAENDVPAQVTCDDVIAVVGAYFDLKRSDLVGAGRQKKVSTPRHIAMFLVRKLTELSYPEIGDQFERDHTSVMHGVKKIEQAISNDENIRNLTNYLSKQCQARHAR